MRGDFHIHSNYSDGVFTIEQLLELAKEKDLDYIAITDHDVISGALHAYNIQSTVKVIVGLELSTTLQNESVHILGYYTDLSKIHMIEDYLETQRKNRLERAKKIKELLLQHFNIDLDIGFMKKIDSITRGTIANEIIKQGYPYTKELIFDEMIGKGCPAYLPSTKMTTEFGIHLIKETNGLAVLAHPVLLKKAKIEDIIEMGIDGIEAIYKENQNGDEDRFVKLAQDNNLCITAGSDFHSFNDHKHGDIGEVFLEGEYLEIFLNKLEVKK